MTAREVVRAARALIEAIDKLVVETDGDGRVSDMTITKAADALEAALDGEDGGAEDEPQVWGVVSDLGLFSIYAGATGWVGTPTPFRYGGVENARDEAERLNAQQVVGHPFRVVPLVGRVGRGERGERGETT